MDRDTAKFIYIEACRVKRRTPEKGELDQWARQFELNEPEDLRAALNAWWADRTPTGNGQPRGSFFPQPVELKPLVQTEYSRRLARSSVERLLARWRCEACGATRCGFIEASDHNQRYCRGIPRDQGYERGTVCGANMAEVFRSEYNTNRERAA